MYTPAIHGPPPLSFAPARKSQLEKPLSHMAVTTVLTTHSLQLVIKRSIPHTENQSSDAIAYRCIAPSLHFAHRIKRTRFTECNSEKPVKVLQKKKKISQAGSMNSHVPTEPGLPSSSFSVDGQLDTIVIIDSTLLGPRGADPLCNSGLDKRQRGRGNYILKDASSSSSLFFYYYFDFVSFLPFSIVRSYCWTSHEQNGLSCRAGLGAGVR